MSLRTELLREIRGAQPVALSLVPTRLCNVAAHRLRAQGVGVALISSPQSRSLLAGSGDLAGVVEDLQFSLGEGPCLDAFAAGSAVLEPDLSADGRSRWPLFAASALKHGVHSVFAFPLLIGAARFGVLDVARDRPGMLDDDQLADAFVLADIATETVLELQDGTPDDQIADDLGGLGSERIVVHQATGMVTVQAQLGPADALALLRAHAFAHNLSLYEVAQSVVNRRLDFSP